MSYWDTSTLGKLYVPEPDSADFEQKAANEPIIFTARFALYEMRRVAFRKESAGLIPEGTAEAVLSQMDQDITAGEIRLVELDTRVEAEFNALMAACYRRSPALPIRTLDALHLASARVCGETEIVVADKRLRDAAILLGFSVFPA
ncbi:MAG TPA: type II toxin-antitoxin system VapC family toxin [Verrucomicrobiae bacterium]|nr:type II toxin-antitoxin system VapC family toxin [Verrucomicrobiae bacterium]